MLQCRFVAPPPPSKGYFVVYFYKNLEEYEIRIFDKDGRFQYIVEFPEKLSGRSTIFTTNGFACIEREDNRDLYVEYKITNLPVIFANELPSTIIGSCMK